MTTPPPDKQPAAETLGQRMIKSGNCQVEPPYPLPETAHIVVFSIRAPDYAAHKKHKDCNEEYPHLISECGMFEQKTK